MSYIATSGILDSVGSAINSLTSKASGAVWGISIRGPVVPFAQIRTLAQAADYAAAGYRAVKGKSEVVAKMYYRAYSYARGTEGASFSTAKTLVAAADKAWALEQAKTRARDVTDAITESAAVTPYEAAAMPASGEMSPNTKLALLVAAAGVGYWLYQRSTKMPDGWPKGKEPAKPKSKGAGVVIRVRNSAGDTIAKDWYPTMAEAKRAMAKERASGNTAQVI